jgi:hypothetical protein
MPKHVWAATVKLDGEKMLRIRREQMQILGAAMQRSFELRMLAEFRADARPVAENMSDDEVLRTITLGIEAASQYGIVNEPDVQRYLEYMFIYGAEFDTDPEKERLAEILLSDIVGNKKMDRIDEYHLTLQAT